MYSVHFQDKLGWWKVLVKWQEIKKRDIFKKVKISPSSNKKLLWHSQRELWSLYKKTNVKLLNAKYISLVCLFLHNMCIAMNDPCKPRWSGADPGGVDGVAASHPSFQMKKKKRKWVFLKLYLKLITASNWTELENIYRTRNSSYLFKKRSTFTTTSRQSIIILCKHLLQNRLQQLS